MKLPRNVSGQQLVKALVASWSYRWVHQVGSHIILQTDEPVHHRLAVPNHHALRIGTLNGILRDVARVKRVTRQAILDSL